MAGGPLFVFSSRYHRVGCPTFPRFWEGWAARMHRGVRASTLSSPIRTLPLSGRRRGQEQRRAGLLWSPTLPKIGEGWGTRICGWAWASEGLMFGTLTPDSGCRCGFGPGELVGLAARVCPGAGLFWFRTFIRLHSRWRPVGSWVGRSYLVKSITWAGVGVCQLLSNARRNCWFMNQRISSSFSEPGAPVPLASKR